MVSIKTIAVLGLTGAALVTVLLFRNQLVQGAFALGQTGGQVITAPFLGLASAFTQFEKTITGALNPPAVPSPGGAPTTADVNAAIAAAGLPPAVPGTQGYISAASLLPSSTIDQAAGIIEGTSPDVNVAGNTDLKTALNALQSQLSQQAAAQETGQTPVGEFLLSNGLIEPLTQNAADYYHSIGVYPKEVVAY